MIVYWPEGEVRPGYRVTIEPGEYHCQVKVLELQGWSQEPGAKDDVWTPELLDNDGNEVPIFDAMIKWDGCSHFSWGEPDNAGYIHQCGASSYREIAGVLLWVLEKAPEWIEHWNAGVADP